jgi:MFS family permease
MDTSATTAQPPPWRDVFRGSQGRLIVGLLVLETLFALHFLTVTTVMPAVLDDLGGLALYGWSATAASLAQIAAIPIAGAAVDRYGPKLVLVIVAIAYTAGMLITATAPEMIVVAIGRFFQGLAAGGAYALSLAIMAKALPERHRWRRPSAGAGPSSCPYRSCSSAS